MKKKLLTILAALAIASIPAIVVAAALSQETVGNSLTVIDSRVADLAVFEDSNCTIELTSIDWGTIDLKDGDPSADDLWETFTVKNTGDYEVTNIVLSTDIGAGTGSISFTNNNFTLAPGAKATIDVFLTPDAGITVGTYDTFSIFIDGTYTP